MTSLHLEEALNSPTKKILEIMQHRIMHKSTYFGVKTHKNPLDMWVYQEILFESKPDVIIEIGNKYGGSTLAFAHMLDNLGRGRIVGVDIDHSRVESVVKEHPRISLLEGDGLEMIMEVEKLILPNDRVLVIEDSAHTFDTTLALLRLYERFVKAGDYFIVEDSICHHGLDVGPNPGPYEAIEVFVQENSDFEIDRSREDFLITWNPKGFLKRVS